MGRWRRRWLGVRGTRRVSKSQSPRLWWAASHCSRRHPSHRYRFLHLYWSWRQSGFRPETKKGPHLETNYYWYSSRCSHQHSSHRFARSRQHTQSSTQPWLNPHSRSSRETKNWSHHQWSLLQKRHHHSSFMKFVLITSSVVTETTALPLCTYRTKCLLSRLPFVQQSPEAIRDGTAFWPSRSRRSPSWSW